MRGGADARGTDNMAKKIFHCVLLATLVLSGCASPGPGSNATLYVRTDKPGKALLDINCHQWDGFWGPEGYTGYRYLTYWATLDGTGPVFHNPHFEDMPPDFRCIGDIILDMEHHEVTLRMRRIISKPGESQRTVRHPANGTYHFDVKQAGSLLQQSF